MFVAWALSQIKQPVIEPGFIAATIQITAITAIPNLQLSPACALRSFIETYFALMRGGRLAALESDVFLLHNRCEAREQKHSLCCRPLARVSSCRCLLAHQPSGTWRASSWGELDPATHLGSSSKSCISSALFCSPAGWAAGNLHSMPIVPTFCPAGRKSLFSPSQLLFSK